MEPCLVNILSFVFRGSSSSCIATRAARNPSIILVRAVVADTPILAKPVFRPLTNPNISTLKVPLVAFPIPVIVLFSLPKMPSRAINSFLDIPIIPAVPAAAFPSRILPKDNLVAIVRPFKAPLLNSLPACSAPAFTSLAKALPPNVPLRSPIDLACVTNSL